MTLKDVAKACGVHFATVSAVLHGGKSGTRVAPLTREKIRQAADELGYRPNLAARALRTGGPKTLGWACGLPWSSPDIAIIGDVLTGIQQACGQAGRNFLLPWAYPSLDTEALIQWTNSGLMDGVLLIPGPTLELEEYAAATSVRTVCILTPSPLFPSFCTDDAAGGKLQARRIIEKGHRAVLYHAYHPFIAGVAERRAAFMEEVTREGIIVHEVATEYWDRQHVVYLDLLKDLMSGPNPVTALVAWNDETAHRWLEALLPTGLRVPDDLAVLGFDGVKTQVGVPYALTTVSAGIPEMMEAAVEALCSRQAPPSGTTFTPPFLVEGTTG